jgi:hypothetical protein
MKRTILIQEVIRSQRFGALWERVSCQQWQTEETVYVLAYQ